MGRKTALITMFRSLLIDWGEALCLQAPCAGTVPRKLTLCTSPALQER